MKNYLDGGEAILESFRNLGADYVMSSPGSEWGALWEAFARQQVNKTPGPIYLSCAHETLAVDLAIGYTAVTDRLQVVVLHTGVGLLQGSMGIDAAARQGIPMLVVSGEALTYGDKPGFEPGPQWFSALSVVGGTHRLVEPLVKWSNQISSPETLYEQLVRAGEIAQRTPKGPTYLCVPIETMLADWTPPARLRKAPPAPKPIASPADIERVAALLATAENPLIMTESVGRDPAAREALIEFAELLGIPVRQASWSDYANFPRNHPLNQGFGLDKSVDEADVILTVRSRAPWYPPKYRPKKATIIAIDENPFRETMVYQALHADSYLEGDVATTLRNLTASLKSSRVVAAKVKARGESAATGHAKVAAGYEKDIAGARKNGKIHPIGLAATLSETLPSDAIYVDETITHRGMVLKYAQNGSSQSYFRVHGGLGQGLGVALGVKLANKDRPVVSVIGDGSFMYNPVMQSLALAKDAEIPIMIVVFNNNGYEAMKREHQAYYPDGVAAAKDIFHGKPVTGFDYAEAVKPFGAFGRRVDKPAELGPALKEGMKAVKDGKTALLNVIIDP